MKAAILVFPGSNCDIDLYNVLTREYKIDTKFLWFNENFKPEFDYFFIPGGFSYGDYLRSGAMAAVTPSIQSLKEAAKKDKKIIGICNGFQILTESHLLPGALIRNKDLRHICKWVDLIPEEKYAPFFPQSYALPISHSEGNYIASDEQIKEMEDNEQILFRYKKNPNGSTKDIAGIINQKGNIIGLMPHPERAIYETDDHPLSEQKFGKFFFEYIFHHLL